MNKSTISMDVVKIGPLIVDIRELQVGDTPNPRVQKLGWQVGNERPHNMPITLLAVPPQGTEDS
ncbi:hypothetical protein [Corynebacterium epidermidicanis]|uniref:Uncharacterized protein n=1 Tax=Corynebacterium epidermidicanis TaxID=1050174 RepID=A0A0G3GMV9_9CORY|nr:hypothetical protein [Corynebacterium epidermidicanis]AKK02479.1 hypothetical protein CEPID_02995 [Corynebacterium epidermidicanis]